MANTWTRFTSLVSPSRIKRINLTYTLVRQIKMKEDVLYIKNDSVYLKITQRIGLLHHCLVYNQHYAKALLLFCMFQIEGLPVAQIFFSASFSV